MLGGLNGPPAVPEEEKSSVGVTVIGPAEPGEVIATLKDPERSDVAPAVHWAVAETEKTPDEVHEWDCVAAPYGDSVASPQSKA